MQGLRLPYPAYPNGWFRALYAQELAAGEVKALRAIIRDLEKQMSQDVPIWEHKAYWARPALCDGDGPIATYRRWMRRFFDASW